RSLVCRGLLEEAGVRGECFAIAVLREPRVARLKRQGERIVHGNQLVKSGLRTATPGVDLDGGAQIIGSAGRIWSQDGKVVVQLRLVGAGSRSRQQRLVFGARTIHVT